MDAQDESQLRTGNGRNRVPSRRAREAAENDNLEDPPPKKASGKQKRKHADTENDGVTQPEPPRTRRKAEFAFETLSTNRTSQRSSNVINLHANRDGIPPPKTATPARLAGGQRVPAPTPAKTKNRLTKEAAARLAAIRQPYATPTKSTAGPQASSSSSSRVGQSATPRPPSMSATPRPPSMSSTAARRPEMATVSYVKPAPAPASSSSAAVTATSKHIMDRTTMLRQESHPDETADDAACGAQGVKRAISISESGRTWGVGQIPTSRVDIRDREASVPFQPEGTDDVDSDDEHVFDDYDSDPRAAATEEAYGPSIQNPYAVNVHEEHFDDEELQEMADDPEADMEDDEQDHEPIATHGDDHHRDHAPPSPVRRSSRQLKPSQRSLEETSTPRRAQRTDTPARKKPRSSDYDTEAKQVLDYAFTLYKVKLTSEHAYPDAVQARTWAKLAWQNANEDLEITRYSWNLRGEVKTAARGAVQGAYGFKSATYNNPRAIAHNEKIVQMLLNKRAYKYEDPENKEGLYEADIIQMIINRVYYKDSRDDGVIHDSAYRPFPFEGVALVLTALECAIDEWQTGTFQNVDFNERYKTVYASHVIDIKKFEEDSHDDQIMTEICTTLAENGRFHAKVPVFIPAEDVGSLTTDDTARAIAAYRLRKQSRAHGPA